jgi:hypothetical protein
MKRACVLAVAIVAAFPGTASAYVECGNPPGPARNVTAVDVSCPSPASDGAAQAAIGCVAVRSARTSSASVDSSVSGAMTTSRR